MLFILTGLTNHVMGQTLLDDNFDAYTIGTFPTTWVLKYSGFGASLQSVSNTKAVSASNSLKLEGKSNNSANADFMLKSTPDVVWLEVSVNTSKLETAAYPTYSTATVCFNNETASSWGQGYAGVNFIAGSIYTSTGVNLQNFTEGLWYKVKIKYMVSAKRMDVYIDDVLKATNIVLAGNNTKYNSVLLQGGNACHTLSYFDDVKVWDDLSTGMNEIKTTNLIQIYPNPATNKITIKNQSTVQNQQISIYDVQGQLVLSSSSKQAITDIDISKLAKGLYVTKIGNDEKVSTQSFIKE